MKIEGYQFKRHNDDDWIDEINMVTVPRYKESHLSGDEWRISCIVELKRKGTVLFSKGFRNTKYAAAWIPWGVASANEEEEWVEFPDNETYCAQPGCSAQAILFYAIKKLFDWHGEECRHQTPSWRGFCSAHLVRGDSDMEDSDDNYENIVVPVSTLLEIDISKQTQQ